jgi:hypothetical protein
MRQKALGQQIHSSEHIYQMESVAKECSEATGNQFAVSILDNLSLESCGNR